MSALILGLLMFLGMHSARIVAEGWRTQVIAQRGPGAWKGMYTVVSLVGDMGLRGLAGLFQPSLPDR